YDGVGRPSLQRVTNRLRGQVKRQKTYIWDVNLRLKAIKDVKGIKEFEHTTRRFLAKTTFENGEVQLKNPDPVGNLYKTAERKDRVYAPGGKLQKMNGWQFSYNDEGKLVEKKHIIHG